MSSVNIIQISDLHIGLENENPHGINVKQNFENIIKSIKNENFDLLVISGDLCFRDPSTLTYNYVKSVLKSFEKKTIIIPGNHDNSVEIATIFNSKKYLQNEDLFFKKVIHKIPMFFLDSSKGVVSPEQIDWLNNEIKKYQQHIYLFIHHPPMLADVPHMDINWPLINHLEVQEELFKHPNRFSIFCGHYHIEKTIEKNNISMYLCPSTFFNIDPKSKEFKIDNYLVGYRKIKIMKEEISTSVIYI